MNNLTPARVLALLVAFALVFSACKKEEEVGSGVKIGEGGTPNTRLGETTTTTAPPTTTTAPAAPTTATTAAPKTTTTAAPRTTTTRKINAFDVSINGDQSGKPQFEPSSARVCRNGVVRFTNTDSVPRSVESDTGKFSTPSIAPGASFDYKATINPGRYNFHDGTRPYAVGTLEVVAC